MYSMTTLAATETAARVLTDIAEYFGQAARSCNGTSVVARREAALRVRALEALAALDSIGDDDLDDVMPAGLARSLETPISDLLGLTSTPLDVLAASMPPIAGGAPFEPTDEDWADYYAHRDQADADRDLDALHRDIFGY